MTPDGVVGGSNGLEWSRDDPVPGLFPWKLDIPCWILDIEILNPDPSLAKIAKDAKVGRNGAEMGKMSKVSLEKLALM